MFCYIESLHSLLSTKQGFTLYLQIHQVTTTYVVLLGIVSLIAETQESSFIETPTLSQKWRVLKEFIFQ